MPIHRHREYLFLSLWLLILTLIVMSVPLIQQPVAYPQAQPTSTFRAGVSWDDIRVEPTSKLSPGTGVPAFEKWYDDGAGSNGVYCYSFTDEAVAGNEKQLWFNLQLPHAGRIGSAIHIHVHWVGASTVLTSSVVWGLESTWAEPITGYFTNTTIITATAREGGGIHTYQYGHNLTEFTPFTPTANTDNVSTIMMARIFRNSSIATDTYTDKVCLEYVDAHFIVDSLGSVSEYNK